MGVVWGRSIGLGSAFFGLDAFADSSASEWGGNQESLLFVGHSM